MRIDHASMTSLFVIHIPSEERNLTDYWDLLNEQEQSSAERFVRYSDKLCYIVTRGSLRTLLAENIDFDPSDLKFHYEPKGKPYLDKNKHQKMIFFNASHSGEYSLIGLNTQDDLGVDIERKREIRNLDGLAKRFFTSGEYEEFAASDDKESAFFSIWTLKEALVKLTGRGISGGLAQFDVTLNAEKGRHLTSISDENLTLNQVVLSPFEFRPDYSCAFATTAANPDFEVLEFRLQKEIENTGHKILT